MSGPTSTDGYEIPLRSRSVLRVYVQSGFSLQVADDGTDTAIHIGDPLAVVSENDPLLGVRADAVSLGKVIVRGRELCDQRRLQIQFLPGVWFQVEPEVPEGRWGPAGSKGLIRVCMPGGEMAIWFGGRVRRA